MSGTNETRFYQLLSGALPASVCPDCGALVWNTSTHDAWHAHVAECLDSPAGGTPNA